MDKINKMNIIQIDLLNSIKIIFQNLVFQEISKDFIKKKNFEWMISIYLFTKKSQFIFFKWFDFISFVFNYKKKKLFTFIVSKELITKFQFGYKNYFYLLLLENNEFLQFYLQKYFNLIFIYKGINFL